jgi:mono/diheme cytochrome c family protein
MRIKTIACSIAFLATMLGSAHVRAQGDGEPAKGLALARQVCVVCHAIEKGQISSPNPAAPRFNTIANVPGMTPLALTVALRTSHRSMPNLVLEDEELRNIAAYIVSLK